MASKLRQRSPGDPVLERLDELRRDSVRAERVYQYVATGHQADCSTTDLLHVLRAAPDLALEIRANTGRDVIAAGTDDTGDVRYAVWRHSAVAAKVDGGPPVRERSWTRRSNVKQSLENATPRVRLRDDTPLWDLEVPGEFRTRAPGRTIKGP